MIRFIRTSKFNAFGKEKEYETWIKDMRELLNKLLPSGKIDVFFNRLGELGTIHWMADFESLAEMEKWQAGVNSEEYQALSKKLFEMGVHIPGTTVDSILSHID